MSDFLGSDAAAASVVLLLRGAALTLVISAAGILAGFAIALPICAARLSRSVPLRAGAAFYVSFFRGVPLLIQLLVIYYLLPFLGLELPGVVAAVIGLARVHGRLPGRESPRRVPRGSAGPGRGG